VGFETGTTQSAVNTVRAISNFHDIPARFSTSTNYARLSSRFHASAAVLSFAFIKKPFKTFNPKLLTYSMVQSPS